MGIRVHKVIGYGLDDVQTDGFEITDPRFNLLGWALADWENRENTWTLDGFQNYAKHYLEMYGLFEEILEKPDWPWRFPWVHHNTEFGLPNVFLIQSACSSRHFRYDDTIDYHEETALYQQANRVAHIPWGVWPYNGSFMDRRTGERVRFGSDLMRCLDPGFTIDKEVLNRLAKKCGFLDADDARINLGPIIPEEIELMCRWLCLFNDESTIWQLKPMLYVYWS